ncbi:MAG TPA: energy-coupling factor transporter ATPase [Firmicutes bacterium]|nr:energy-coupling factor transporter ATPase [Bacillota bacterium]
MFRIIGVSHYYNEGRENQVEALADINLEIRRGEFVTIIGTNGSGKSTLAKHLNALLLPSRGRVLVKDMDTRDAGKLWNIRQTVGMVFQNPDNQIVATTVEEDVAFGPENLGIPPAEIRRRVDEALAIVDMAEYKQAAPHLLSGGQKQRIAIAGVIAMRPECIVLDEPTAMLDPSGREEVMATVLKLNREEGITVVHITHYMEEAVWSDRVLVMDGGRIILAGTPREIFGRVAEIKAIGLDVPQVTDLAARLQRDGYPLPAGILTVEEMVRELCQLE